MADPVPIGPVDQWPEADWSSPAWTEPAWTEPDWVPNAPAISCLGANSPVTDDYMVSSPFGLRGREFHRGVDLSAPAGTPILAALGGEVVRAGPADGFGNWVVIDSMTPSGLVSTVYGHMYSDGIKVKVNDTVTPGQHIADVGSAGQSTGPHLHFEEWVGGRFAGGSAVDPMPLVEQSDLSVKPAAECEADVAAGTVPDSYVPWLKKAGSICPGISAALLAAQIEQESGFRTNATSPAGAQGPSQFMPGTWASRGVDGDGDGVKDVRNIADAVVSQGHLMCSNLAATSAGVSNGSLRGNPVDLALAAYNAGLGAVVRAGGMPSGGDYTTQTQPYVQRILSRAQAFAPIVEASPT